VSKLASNTFASKTLRLLTSNPSSFLPAEQSATSEQRLKTSLHKQHQQQQCLLAKTAKTHSTASYPGQPAKFIPEKGKLFLILIMQEMLRWRWHQTADAGLHANHLLVPGNHGSTSSLNFYRLDIFSD